MQTKATPAVHEELAKKLHRRSFIEKYRFEERLFAQGKIAAKPVKPSEELITADWLAREALRTMWLGVAEEATNYLRR